MLVTLRHFTPLEICSLSIRTCWQSFDKGDGGGEKDKELINRVGNVLKHASTLEHIVYNFYIQDISRALLQELSRHRMASLSVKSTRYTLSELKKQEPFIGSTARERAEKFLVMTKSEEVNLASIEALERLRALLESGVRADLAKYALPESYKTELSWSVNARSLQNFLSLRSGKSALWEIRQLALKVYEVIPEEHKMLYSELMTFEGLVEK